MYIPNLLTNLLSVKTAVKKKGITVMFVESGAGGLMRFYVARSVVDCT